VIASGLPLLPLRVSPRVAEFGAAFEHLTERHVVQLFETIDKLVALAGPWPRI
jgi:hypothetical protein